MPRSKRSRSNTPSTLHHIPHLASTTLSIHASRVRKSWKPLPTNTQERIKTLLLAIQSETLASLQDPSRRGRNALFKAPASRSSNGRPPAAGAITDADTEAAITSLVHRLTKALPKMSFPPPSSGRRRTNTNTTNTASTTAASANDADFSLESTLTRTAALTQQINQATQSARMLRAQIRREEVDLRRDRRELSGLEGNMARAEAGRREAQGRLHFLARGVGDGDEDGVVVKVEGDEDEGVEGIYEEASKARLRPRGRVEGGEGLLGAEEVAGDEELSGLAKGLRSHLASMRSNTQGLNGVRRELRRAEREVRLWGLRRGVAAV